jgi:hypothetical protein
LEKAIIEYTVANFGKDFTIVLVCLKPSSDHKRSRIENCEPPR